MGYIPNVGGDFVYGGSHRRQRGKDVDVNLSRVSLAGHRVRVGKSRKLGDELVELLDLDRSIELSTTTFDDAQDIEDTFSWSPSKRDRKDAWVPVVPFTPRNPRSSKARFMLRRSHNSSYTPLEVNLSYNIAFDQYVKHLDP
jgi:hypothetical protein